jgi:hypothetical protein
LKVDIYAVALCARKLFNPQRAYVPVVVVSGNVTTYRDRIGRITGTAERRRDGSTVYATARAGYRLSHGAARR